MPLNLTFSFKLLSKIHHVFLFSHTCHPTLFKRPQKIRCELAVIKLIMQFSPSLSGPNILVNALFFQHPNLCSSLRMRNKVLHPHKTRVTISVQHICMWQHKNTVWQTMWQTGIEMDCIMCLCVMTQCQVPNSTLKLEGAVPFAVFLLPLGQTTR